jgi:hypothetical protein
MVNSMQEKKHIKIKVYYCFLHPFLANISKATMPLVPCLLKGQSFLHPHAVTGTKITTNMLP